MDPEFPLLFEALSNTETIEFFDLKAIQKLVDFNYPLCREYVVKKLFIPYGFFLLIFFTFMHFIYPYKEEEIGKALFYPFLIANVVMATYFMINEVRQLMGEGLSYLASFWNYIDLVPPIGIYFISAVLIFEELNIKLDVATERGLLSVITFFMWMKLLYFLRIFQNTGYLIRMIIEVIKDMQYFFLVLLITIAAFGDSFLRISLGNEPGDD